MSDKLDSEMRDIAVENILKDSSGITTMSTKSDNSDMISKVLPDSKEHETLKTRNAKSLSESISQGTTVSNKSSEREGNCYCGKERNLNIVELLCANCNRWFHESCIGFQLGKLVPFMMNYTFVCKNCSPTGLESFKKTQALFPQMCVTALANLMQQSIKEGAAQTQFSKDKHIIPFIDCHWDSMTTTSRRVTQSWHSTVLRALIKETNIVFECDDTAANGPLYSLTAPDLTQIKPNYETMLKGGQQHAGLKGRNVKRKVPTEVRDQSAPKLPAHGYPLEHPFNKDGYRYILAEPDPHAPFRQEFDERSDVAGKPIPGWLYRSHSPACVRLALHDRAPQLRVADDRLAVTGDKGYCMVRATHSVSRGCWYWEAAIEEMPEGSATRLGWAQEYANLQAPLGFDKFGYSCRSRKGTRFHASRGKQYSRGYGEGDILGCLILLPNTNSFIPPSYKDRPLVKFKSHLYYEEKDRVSECLANLQALSKSKIIFFVNGECLGEAFSDIYAGAYYPTISIHRNATVSANFGPNFRYPPPTSDYKYRGLWEKAEEAICEQTTADLLYLTENDGKLRLP